MLKSIISNLFLSSDKLLDVLGQRKSQKGFLATVVTSLLLSYYPDFPQESFDKLIQNTIQFFNLLAEIWLSVGLIHQWIKDKIVKSGYIPPSVVKRAEATGLPQIVTNTN